MWLNTLFLSAHALWGGCIRFGYIHFLHSRHILSGGCLCIQVNTVFLLCQRHLVIVLQEFQNKQEIQRVQKLCVSLKASVVPTSMRNCGFKITVIWCQAFMFHTLDHFPGLYISHWYLFPVLTKALCHITEVVSGPLVTALEQRKAANVKRREELIREKKKLIALKSLSWCKSIGVLSFEYVKLFTIQYNEININF
jgi:hypothetical protein